jgi:P4 family phage/plasmid primase-like protien
VIDDVLMGSERGAALRAGLARAKEAPWLGKVRVDRSGGEGPEEALRALERSLYQATHLCLAHAEEDVGTGAEFAVLAGGMVRYVQSDDRWMVYDRAEARWKPEDRSGTLNMAKAAAQNRTVAMGGGLKKVTTAHIVQARVAARDLLAATPEMFDRFPAVVNTPDGAMDLDSGKTLKAVPSMLLTKRTAVPFAASPGRLWLDHVRRMTDGDEAIARVLQIAAGLSLYGGQDKPQNFIFLRGQGRNGKGVFLRTIRRALGDYMTVVGKGLFTQRDDAIPHELLQLRGARIAACLEAPRSVVNAASINNLTGGDELQGRRLHGNLQRGFFPTFLPLWISGNEALTLDSKRNEALWERCIFVDVGAPIPTAQRDDTVESRLADPAELGGVLAWLLEGWGMFLDAGRRIPQTEQGEAFIRAAKGSGDAWGRFLRSGRMELELGAVTPLDDLREAYQSWCVQHGEQYADPYVSVAEQVGWANVVTGPDGVSVVRGARLTDAQTTGFGAVIRGAGENR